MASEKNIISGNTTMLVLKLLETKNMYGYQIIEELSNKSEDVFHLKTGTLYPLLHGLENDGMVNSYDENADNQRVRKYYQLTGKGKGLLEKKQLEWTQYTKAVNLVLEEGESYAFA
ncbi:MAG: helix-turn-helix transcriptional regulator [Defluviitaleaceae bacterium]|nr:helix-turn-helix transcriptional regulator [Defluviitaleaceae bacterium]